MGGGVWYSFEIAALINFVIIRFYATKEYKVVKKALKKHSPLDNHPLTSFSRAKWEMSLAYTAIQM